MAEMAAQRVDADEAALVQRAQAGGRAALATLFERHAHPAWRAALAVGGDAERAEQAVVDAFTAVFRRLRGDVRAAGQPFRVLVVRAAMDAAAGDAALEKPVGPNPVATAFGSLPVRWRGALWLADVEGGSDAQVAQLLGLDPDTVASLLDRARRGLRHQLGLQGSEPLPEPQRRELRALVVPMPAGLAASTMTWWLAWHEATVEPKRGVAMVLPLGRWAERALAGAAAAVLTAGIASALALGARDATARAAVAAPGGNGEVAAGASGSSTSAPIAPVSDPAGTATAGAAGPASGRRAAATTSTGGLTTPAPASTAVRAVSPGDAGTDTVPGTPLPPAPSSPAAPGASVGANVAGLPVGVDVSATPGIRVGDTTIGTPPPATPGTASVEVDLGGGLPPITLRLP